MRTKLTFEVLRLAFKSWQKDNVSRLAAAISFYTIVSLSPILIITIGIAAIFFDKSLIQLYVMSQLNEFIGAQNAQQFKVLLTQNISTDAGILATLFGLIIMLVGAVGVFVELQASLNTIWGILYKDKKKFYHHLKKKLVLVTTAVGFELLFLSSVFVSTFITAFGDKLKLLFPYAFVVWITLNFLFSLSIYSILFAMIFKFLPDVTVEWRNVWNGAILTAVLFSIGKFLLEFYFSFSQLGANYGPAGAIIVILVWVYYSAQILFYGAECTKVMSQQRRRKK